MYPSSLAKSTVTYMINFLDSTKVPSIISHAYHENVLLFLPYIVLSQSVLLGLRFIHNSVFSLPPPLPPFLCSYWNLCVARSIIPYAHYIFSTTRTYIKQIIILFLYNYSIFKINHLSHGIILDQVSFLRQVPGMQNYCLASH